MKTKEARIYIGVPSQLTWHADMAMSLMAAVQHVYNNTPPEPWRVTDIAITNVKGSTISKMRERLCDDAIAQGFTHLLFIDSDQTFPEDTIHRLLLRDKAVVGCNVATRALPPQPTARIKYAAEPYFGAALFTGREDKGVRRVWRLGTGIMMVKVDILRKMQKPRFPVAYIEELGDYQGEDWGFCENLEAMEIPIYVDQTLSCEIGHIGQHVFTHETIENQRMVEMFQQQEREAS